MSAPLILLPGALGAAEQFKPLLTHLVRYQTFTYNFPGHGGRQLPTNGLTMEALAEDFIRWLTDFRLRDVEVFGYSMGGYIALLAAAQRPDLIAKVCTLGTKFDWSARTAADLNAGLDPSVIEARAPKAAEVLAARHHKWTYLAWATMQMLDQLGAAPLLTDELLPRIEIPALILRGEGDKVVTEAESRHVADLLPNATFDTIANSRHHWEQTSLPDLLPVMTNFFVIEDDH
jgi:pimeloyl-ACP methyl ester carboxylesterase